MKLLLQKLINQIGDKASSTTSIIPWATPIISFGNYENAHVATLGLNPSNREFVDKFGNELLTFERRFHTLNSLGLINWKQIDHDHLLLIEDSCKNYFSNNPYNLWFRDMELLISGVKKSFYSSENHACHLDLIPFATSEKWAKLSNQEKNTLLEISGKTLAEILNNSQIELLILNGKSVVENFEKISTSKLEVEKKPEWNLKRKDKESVAGYSYKSIIKNLCGINLNKQIKILGFNHNLQSSYGVSSQVKSSIREWIAESSQKVKNES